VIKQADLWLPSTHGMCFEPQRACRNGRIKPGSLRDRKGAGGPALKLSL
jgi:hypothetical protein